MFWNVRATPRPMILSGRPPVMSRPSKEIRPVVGLYRPVSMLKKVVLPAPLGPMIETIERSGIEKSTSLTATRPPNSLETPLASSRTSPSRVGPARAPAPVVRVPRTRLAAPRTRSSPVPTPSVSSSLRLRSGSRPSGRSTIMSTSRKPKIAEGQLGEVEVQAELVRARR